jgi:Uma2 family endonuclease
MTMTHTPALKPAGTAWTVEDLFQLPEDGNRYEIAHGSLLVTPAPALRHIDVNSRLYDALRPQTPDGLRTIAVGAGVNFEDLPFGNSFYIPDLLVVPDEVLKREGHTIDPSEVLLAAEILSPSNAGNDLILKRHDYGAAGIPTYWIVDPKARTLTVLEHNGKGGYDEAATVKAGETWRSERPFPLAVDSEDFT